MTKQGAKTVMPRLRFPEFRGAPSWIEKTLGDEGEFLSPLTGKTAQHFGTGNAKYVTYMNVFANTFTDMATLGVVDVTEGESQNSIEPGDVLFTVSSETPEEVGMSSVVVDAAPNCYVNSFCAMFRFSGGKQPNLRFLGYALRQPFARRHFVKRAQGSTRFNLSKPAFRSLPLALPIAAEQQKIADCLTSLDEVIVAQGRKVEALKAHKRGLMQQLFPREGETRPRLRFPEFRSAPEWKWMPLGGIAEIKLGKMLDSNKQERGRLLPYVNNISLRWNEVDTSDLPQMYFKESELERYGLRAGDVLVCEGGEPGRSAVWDGRLPDLKFQKAIHRVRFHKPFVPKLLVLYLEAIAGSSAFESLFTGGGIKHLTGETFAKLAVPVMSLAEQQRIADCLSSLDTRITAETSQLAALKTHKQGLMQQLFPVPEAMGA